jgi:alpha-N-acetylglucosaminidase
MPSELYEAWEVLRTNVYSNTRGDIPQVAVATYQLRPALSGIVNRTGHFPHPTAVHYDPAVLQQVWKLMLESVLRQGQLWSVPAFRLDFIDVTRQMLSNQFDFVYIDLINAYKCSISVDKELRSDTPKCDVQSMGNKLLGVLSTLDNVLLTEDHFTLQSWVNAAGSWGSATGNQDLFVFNARSQVTMWQVDATNLNDYAAKAWGGLVGSYYKGRWSIFVNELVAASKSGSLDQSDLTKKLRAFETNWQAGNDNSMTVATANTTDFKTMVPQLQKEWSDIFPQA